MTHADRGASAREPCASWRGRAHALGPWGWVALFGLGYAMCDATQYAQAIQIGEQTGGAGGGERALGALRLIERLAAIAGLIASVILIPRLGYSTITVGIGVLMLCGTLLMLGGGTGQMKSTGNVHE